MGDRYAVELTGRAAKTLRRLDRPVQARILMALTLLRDEPRPPAATALVGHPGYLRVRVGDYRIVYTVDDGKLLVLVFTLGHRSVIYRDLP